MDPLAGAGSVMLDDFATGVADAESPSLAVGAIGGVEVARGDRRGMHPAELAEKVVPSVAAPQRAPSTVVMAGRIEADNRVGRGAA